MKNNLQIKDTNLITQELEDQLIPEYENLNLCAQAEVLSYYCLSEILLLNPFEVKN